MILTSIIRHHPSPDRRTNVLWIDDNIENFSGQIARLSINGFQVFCVKSISDFISVISNYYIDVAIIDLKLQGADSGRDLVKYVNMQHKSTRVILYSNYIDAACDFKKDKFGNTHLSINNEDIFAPLDEQTRLDHAVSKLAKSEREYDARSLNKSSNWKSSLIGWSRITSYARFGLTRVAPIFVIGHIVLKFSAATGAGLNLVKHFISDWIMLSVVALILLGGALNHLLCPKYIRKSKGYADFMKQRLVMYENDEEFSKDVNNYLESSGMNYKDNKSFNRLKHYFDLSNQEI